MAELALKAAVWQGGACRCCQPSHAGRRPRSFSYDEGPCRSRACFAHSYCQSWRATSCRQQQQRLVAILPSCNHCHQYVRCQLHATVKWSSRDYLLLLLLSQLLPTAATYMKPASSPCSLQPWPIISCQKRQKALQLAAAARFCAAHSHNGQLTTFSSCIEAAHLCDWLLS